jgi:hypothetical protein
MSTRIALIGAVLFVGACGQTSDSFETTPIVPDESITTEATEATIVSDATRHDDSEKLVEAAVLARMTLASELGIGEEELKFISAQAVTWRDGSIGCPDPATSYTQALVDGYLVVFDHEGEFIEVHQAVDDKPIVCLKPATDAFIPPTKKTPEIFVPPPIR